MQNHVKMMENSCKYQLKIMEKSWKNHEKS